MKNLIVSLSVVAMLATSVVPAMAQDATSPSTETAKADKPKADKKRLWKAGGLGCLTGGAVALLSGKKDKAVAACAVGAAVGSVASYKKQMDEVRELAAQAQAAGMAATVATKEATAQSGEKVEALDSVVIAYDPASMSARDPQTVAVLDKISTLAKRSKEPLTIAAEGRDMRACQIPLAELSARDTFPPAKAIDKCGQGKPQLVITPVPDLT
ncbi:hypothetical protein RY963_000915 [Stenotrophomonas maltophilia]|nr:hypothetical protein [Stenotrophomonas maltophilia]ELN2592088.1 hypothetical protein [Stenotrophomonas maltophilia]MBH1400040.1 hypothetical protein [Stenotrophomonas maltophilia]